jgi:hypothetical protein
MASMVRVVLVSRTLERPHNFLKRRFHYEKGISSLEFNSHHQTRQIRYAHFRCQDIDDVKSRGTKISIMVTVDLFHSKQR